MGKLKGEAIVVDSKKASQPDFFNALMSFQYGEGEEVDAAFKKMTQLSQDQDPQSDNDGKA